MRRAVVSSGDRAVVQEADDTWRDLPRPTLDLDAPRALSLGDGRAPVTGGRHAPVVGVLPSPG